MAFVSVPKDLTKVKNKVVLNLTKRQIICLVIAAADWAAFLFPDKRIYRDKQCVNWHGDSHAPGIYVCHR